MDDDSELVSIYYGDEVDEKDAEQIKSVIEKNHPDVDVEVNCGGQPIYYYIVSVE